MAEALPEVFATDTAVETLAQAAEVTMVTPTLLGLEPYQWVSISMVVLILIAIFGANVHKIIARGLDNKIDAIRHQLNEAKKLRAEAEELRAEYAAKIAGAERDATSMLENARKEAEAIVSKAEADTAALIARRERMVQDKIAAAERKAMEDLRAAAASASTMAAAELIRERHDAAADRRLADQVIASL